MDKKGYILKMLDLFKDTLPLARGLSILIQNSDIDESFLNTIISAFQESIDQIKDEKIKSQLNKGKAFLEELKRKEAESNKLDEEDIKHLNDLLESI